jgi:hypothetical protein
MVDNEIPNPTDMATMENLVPIMDGLTQLTYTTSPNLKEMRERMYAETRRWQLTNETRTVSEVAPFILGFLQGWRSSEKMALTSRK